MIRIPGVRPTDVPGVQESVFTFRSGVGSHPEFWRCRKDSAIFVFRGNRVLLGAVVELPRSRPGHSRGRTTHAHTHFERGIRTARDRLV